MYALKDKIYVFDLDGTLADAMPVAVKIILDFLTEQGVSYPDGIVKEFTPLGYKGVAEYYVSRFGVQMTAEDIYACFSRRLEGAYAHEIPLKAQVREVLQTLKAKNARLNVLTGTPHVFTDVCLKERGVFSLFENVWSVEDFGLKKSDKAIYVAVAQSLGARVEDIVMVDDSLEVIKAAKSAGAWTVGVYDASWEKEWEKMRKTAHYSITEFSQLLEF